MIIENSNFSFIDFVNEDGKGRPFRSRFIEAGLVNYENEGLGQVLVKKETIDKFLKTMVGCPVIINHKTITNENSKTHCRGRGCSNVHRKQYCRTNAIYASPDGYTRKDFQTNTRLAETCRLLVLDVGQHLERRRGERPASHEKSGDKPRTDRLHRRPKRTLRQS